MNVILLGLCFLGYSSYLVAIKQVDVLNTPFIFCSFSVFWLYVFGICGLLPLGSLLFLWGGIIIGLGVIYKKGNFFSAFRLKNFPYMAFLIPYFLLYTRVSGNYLFTGWDEFSFWGTSIKIIFESNSLYLADSPTVLKHYPPAQQLFQYFILKNSWWSEKNVLLAQGIFILSCLLFVASNLVKNLHISLILFYTFCISLYFFGYDFSHIYVDPLLSTFFAACLIWTIKKRKTILEYLVFYIAIAVLVLIKEIGFLLALIIFPVFVINEFYKPRQSRI